MYENNFEIIAKASIILFSKIDAKIKSDTQIKKKPKENIKKKRNKKLKQ